MKNKPKIRALINWPLVLISITVFSDKYSDAKLIHVFVTFKTPEHTPINYHGMPPLVNSSNKASDLTEDGARTAFMAGLYLKKKYGSKLELDKSDNYWVAALGHKLNEKTALVLQAGLINDTNGIKTNWDYSDQLEVRLDPEMSRELERYYYEDRCPAYHKRSKNLQKSNFRDILKTYEKELKAVSKNYKESVIKSPEKLWNLRETLEMMKDEKPKWATEQVMNALQTISKEFTFMTAIDPILKKLAGGRMADYILDDIEELTKNKDQRYSKKLNPKLSVLVTSRSVLAAQVGIFAPSCTKFRGDYFNALSLYPEQGAMHVIELHKKDNKWRVKVLYKNSSTTELDIVELPGSNNGFMKYREFKELMKNYRLSSSDLINECTKKRTKKRKIKDVICRIN